RPSATVDTSPSANRRNGGIAASEQVSDVRTRQPNQRMDRQQLARSRLGIERLLLAPSVTARGAHGISGAGGRPAVPSAWRRQPPLTHLGNGSFPLRPRPANRLPRYAMCPAQALSLRTET